MTVYYEADRNKPLSESQLKMLEELRNTTPVPDEDCPEPTYEQLKRLSRTGMKDVCAKHAVQTVDESKMKYGYTRRQ